MNNRLLITKELDSYVSFVEEAFKNALPGDTGSVFYERCERAFCKGSYAEGNNQLIEVCKGLRDEVCYIHVKCQDAYYEYDMSASLIDNVANAGKKLNLLFDESEEKTLARFIKLSLPQIQVEVDGFAYTYDWELSIDENIDVMTLFFLKKDLGAVIENSGVGLRGMLLNSFYEF